MSIAIPCQRINAGINRTQLKAIAASLHLRVPGHIQKRPLCELLNNVIHNNEATAEIIKQHLEQLGFEVHWNIEQVFHNDRQRAADGTELVRVKWVGYAQPTYEPLATLPQEAVGGHVPQVAPVPDINARDRYRK